MRPIAIIQARMGSTRLPGKVLLPLAGKPALWHIVERLRSVPRIADVVVATSTSPGDDAIREFCSEYGVPVHSGSEEDVLDRYYLAAVESSADPVIRITGDCPLVDPGIASKLIGFYEEGDWDHAGVPIGVGAQTLGLNGYPDGLDAACFSFEVLETMWCEATEPEDREHVTTFLWRSPDRFRCGNLSAPHDYSTIRLTIDHPEDYELVSAIYDALYDESHTFSFEDVLEFLDENPEMLQVNAKYVGHEKYRELFDGLAEGCSVAGSDDR